MINELIPRKYKNPVIIGLVILVVLIICYFVFFRKDSTRYHDNHQAQRHAQAIENRPVTNEPVETYVSGDKPTLVLFYGDWCGWSKKILPAWENVKLALSQTGEVEVLDFEDKRDKEEIQKASSLPGFQGFPDIRLYLKGYPNGEPLAYSGDRSEESILQFVYSNLK